MVQDEKPGGAFAKFVAGLQILIIIAIVGFATWQLFLGNFTAAMTTFPLLVIYWFFLTAWQKRS